MHATYTVLKETALQDEAANPHHRSSLWGRLLSNEKATKALYCLAVFLIIATSFWVGAARKYISLDNPPQDIVHLQATEVDYHQLYPSLEAKRTFAETFKWWHEPWRADQWVGAYWRPLSMQAWWIESHLLGEDHSFNWMRISLLLSALFDVLLLRFFRLLTGRRLFALAGLALFALPGSWFHVISPLSVEPRIWNADLLLVQGWKDQPDLFANCLTIGAMILAFDRRYAWSLLCAGLAVCFKESGFMAFPLVAAVVFHRGEFKRVPAWAYGGVVAVISLIMLGRWAAGPLVFHFHTHGGNAGAIARYSNAMLPFALLSLPSFGEALVGLGTFALLLARPQSLFVWLGTLVALLAVAIPLDAWQHHTTLDVAFAQFLLSGLWPVVLFVLWLLVTTIIWEQRTYFRPAVLLAACAFFVAIPFAMVTGALEHVLTLSRAFQAGYGACAVFAVATFIVARLKKRTFSSPEHRY